MTDSERADYAAEASAERRAHHDPCECGAPATKDCDERGWLCEDCAAPVVIACCWCGKPTTWDDTYEDLCYRCCRADNE